MFTCAECDWWERGACLKSGHIDVSPTKIKGDELACDDFESED